MSNNTPIPGKLYYPQLKGVYASGLGQFVYFINTNESGVFCKKKLAVVFLQMYYCSTNTYYKCLMNKQIVFIRKLENDIIPME